MKLRAIGKRGFSGSETTAIIIIGLIVLGLASTGWAEINWSKDTILNFIPDFGMSAPVAEGTSIIGYNLESGKMQVYSGATWKDFPVEKEGKECVVTIGTKKVPCDVKDEFYNWYYGLNEYDGKREDAEGIHFGAQKESDDVIIYDYGPVSSFKDISRFSPELEKKIRLEGMYVRFVWGNGAYYVDSNGKMYAAESDGEPRSNSIAKLESTYKGFDEYATVSSSNYFDSNPSHYKYIQDDIHNLYGLRLKREEAIMQYTIARSAPSAPTLGSIYLYDLNGKKDEDYKLVNIRWQEMTGDENIFRGGYENPQEPYSLTYRLYHKDAALPVYVTLTVFTKSGEDKPRIDWGSLRAEENSPDIDNYKEIKLKEGDAKVDARDAVLEWMDQIFEIPIKVGYYDSTSTYHCVKKATATLFYVDLDKKANPGSPCLR